VRTALLLFVAAVGCRAAFAGGQPVPASREPVPLTRFDNRVAGSSEYSGYREETRVIVRDTVAWRQAWARLNAGKFPQPALPQVDFDREAVVVAAMGGRPSGGYEISIAGASPSADTLDIAIRTTSPGNGCAVSASTTQPVDVAKIPARFRRVRFRQIDSVITCTLR